MKGKSLKELPSKFEFRSLLILATGCGVQHTGWPCGTCFYSISPTLKNKHWQAVLAYRGDYPDLKFTDTRKKLLLDVLKMVRDKFVERT